jgi:hypothetical protein
VARRLAEPLLWLALGAGVVWALAFPDALGARQQATGRPLAPHIAAEAGGLAIGLVLTSGLALVLLRRTPAARWAVAASGLAFVGAGHGFSRVAEIELELQPSYVWGSVGAGLLLVALALLPGWRPAERRPRAGSPGVAGAVAGVLLGLGALWVGTLAFEYNQWGWIGVHEETQPAWDYGVPWILFAVSLVAACVHAWSRRWAAAVLAVVLGFGVLSLGTWATIVSV